MNDVGRAARAGMMFAAIGLAVSAMGLIQPERGPGRPDRPQVPVVPQPDRPQDPPRMPGGPWSHQIHVLTSDDGLAFTEVAEPLMKQASVPDIIELSRDMPAGAAVGTAKGNLCIYTVDARDSRRQPEEGLARLVSTDGGKTWSRPQPVMITRKGSAARGPAVDPSVVQLDDGRLRLYFYEMVRLGPPVPGPGPDRPGELPDPVELPGKRRPPLRPDGPGTPIPVIPKAPDVPPVEMGPHRIYSAISSDGQTFELEEGVRVEESEITDPEVVRAGNEWLMFLSRGYEVVLARSSDGLKFERSRDFILRGGGVPGAVTLADGKVRVYQTGREGVMSVVFDPANGSFRPDEGVRMQGPCGDPAVWPRAGGGYVAVLKRFMGSGPRS